MPFVAVPEVVRVAIVYQDTSGNEAVNVLYFKDEQGEATPTRLDELANTIAAWLSSDWADTAAVAWQANRIELRALDTAEGYYHVETVAIQGAEDGQALPSQNTIAISLRSPFVGRSRRGRIYHVGLSEVATNGDFLVGTSRTVLISAYEALLAATALNDFTWSVVSYVADGEPRTTPLVTAITAITITDDVIDSMDKRKPKA